MRWSIVAVQTLFVGSSLYACGGSSAEVATDAGAPSSANTSEPSSDAAAPDSSPNDAAGDSLVVVRDQKLAGYVQPFDVYFPTNAKRLIVFLHGGLGKKEISPNQIGVTKESAPERAWLVAKQTAFAFPQGSAIAQSPAATTWSNYVMTSGQDDVAFTSALASAARAGSLAPGLAAVPRVYVAGHSNGGMMANRLWCEAASRFDGFAAFAGPASVALRASGTAPCAPSAPRPYLGVIGSADDTISTTGKWAEETWTVTPTLSSGPSFVDPNLVNEEYFHREVRVPKVCATAVAAPVDSGAATTWSDCGGKVRLLRVNGADHCLVTAPTCKKSLEGTLGQPLRDLLVDFFVSTE